MTDLPTSDMVSLVSLEFSFDIFYSYKVEFKETKLLSPRNGKYGQIRIKAPSYSIAKLVVEEYVVKDIINEITSMTGLVSTPQRTVKAVSDVKVRAMLGSFQDEDID